MADIARAIWTGLPRSACVTVERSRRYMVVGSTASSNWPNIQRRPLGWRYEPIHSLPVSLSTYSCRSASFSRYTPSSAKPTHSLHSSLSFKRYCSRIQSSPPKFWRIGYFYTTILLILGLEQKIYFNHVCRFYKRV